MRQELPKQQVLGTKNIFVISATQNEETMLGLCYTLAIIDLNQNQCQKPKSHTQITPNLDLKARIWTKCLHFPSFMLKMPWCACLFQIYNENKEKSPLCIQVTHHQFIFLGFLLFYVLTFAPKSHRKKLSTQTSFLPQQDQSKRHILRKKKKGVERLVFLLWPWVWPWPWPAVIFLVDTQVFWKK